MTARVLLGDVLVGHLDIEGDIVAFTRMVRVAMEDVTYQDIRALAERAGQSADDIESEARGFVERARALWREVRGDAPTFVAMAVDRHLERIAL